MASQPWLKHYDADVPPHLVYPDFPLFEFLHLAAQKYPDRPSIAYQDHLISYKTLNRLSDGLARALVGLGVQKGQPVGLMLPNIPQFLLAYYAVLKAGGVVAAINPLSKQREVEYQLENTGARVLFALSSSLPLVNSLKPTLRPELLILSGSEDGIEMDHWADDGGMEIPADEDMAGQLRAGDLWLKDLSTFYLEDRTSLPQVRSDDPAIFQYTGGTTGIPKAAVGLHRNLVANTLQFRAWLAGLEDGKETFLTAIPLYHVYGMVIGMSVGVAMGARIVLVPDARDISAILSNIQSYQATFFPGVPGMYAAINQNPAVLAGKYNLRSIKACISGSAPLLRHIKEKFESLTGGKLVEGYGLSEAPTATHCNPVQGENRTGSIGLPLPDVEAQIVDLENGKTALPAGEAGELLVRGPQVMAEYHAMPEETALALEDGWLHTGDIARMDTEGYFYLIDRKKEVIKIGGFQVWPREVEEVIAQHPNVQEVGVAGVPDPERGEVVKAWVVLKPGQTAAEEDIREWAASQLSGYKVPSLVEFRGPLPRTPVGKLLRRELVRLHLEAAS